MSDIPTPAVSLNDPIRDILTDLIAELRDDGKSARIFGGDQMNAAAVSARLDRAEQRLKGLTDE